MARIARKYLILDTETATLPFVNSMVDNSNDKRKLAIAKPLVYDIAWKIVDRNGKIYSEHSYLVSETFTVMPIFETAYYKAKRPIYLDRLENNEIIIKHWDDIMKILIEDMEQVAFVGAFNSMFDFKKALPFTEKYIRALYSKDYFKWEKSQKESCERILQGDKSKSQEWDGMHFDFRGEKYPLIDLWGIACDSLINTKTYKRKCLEHKMITESGQYFKSSAETTFRHLCQKYDFEELHMAIDDVNIECMILQKALAKGKIAEGLQYFPFQKLGKTSKFVLSEEHKKPIPLLEVENLVEVIEKKLSSYENQSGFRNGLERECLELIEYLDRHYRELHQYEQLQKDLKIARLEREILKQQKALKELKMQKAIDKKTDLIIALEMEIIGLRN